MYCGCCLAIKSYPTLCNPKTVGLQAPLSMQFLRQEYWKGLLFLSPGDLPDPGIEPMSSVWQADFLPLSQLGSPQMCTYVYILFIVVVQIHKYMYTTEEGNGNPLQYSCLENPMDRGAWQATVHSVARVGHD